MWLQRRGRRSVFINLTKLLKILLLLQYEFGPGTASWVLDVIMEIRAVLNLKNFTLDPNLF